MRFERLQPAAILVANRDAAAELLAPEFAGLAHEELRVLHLGAELQLLEMGRAVGTRAVEVPLRDMIRDALVLGSRGLILAHNHPGGDPSPSRADRLATRRLMEVALPLGIAIIDHLIFAGARCESLRALGLIGAPEGL